MISYLCKWAFLFLGLSVCGCSDGPIPETNPPVVRAIHVHPADHKQLPSDRVQITETEQFVRVKAGEKLVAQGQLDGEPAPRGGFTAKIWDRNRRGKEVIRNSASGFVEPISDTSSKWQVETDGPGEPGEYGITVRFGKDTEAKTSESFLIVE